jgi:hypothetical protein
MTSCVAGLRSFWRNSYEQNGYILSARTVPQAPISLILLVHNAQFGMYSKSGLFQKIVPLHRASAALH